MKPSATQSSGHSDIAIKLFVCIAASMATLYAYIEKQNELTELRLAIPAAAKELRQINDENTRLKYELDQFESPIHLMELARKPEFGHLKNPLVKDVIVISTILEESGARSQEIFSNRRISMRSAPDSWLLTPFTRNVRYEKAN